MKTISLIAALLGLFSAPSRAQTYEVTVKSGSSVFAHKPKFQDGMSNFMGEVVSKDGGARRLLIVNLTPAQEGEMGFQVELTTLDRRQSFSTQSQVKLTPGASVVVAECGGVSVKITQVGKPGKTPTGNHRVALDARFGEDAGRCFVVDVPGSQLNLVAPILFGETRKNLMFNVLLNENAAGYTFDYQVELGGTAAQARAAAAKGKKVAVLKKGDLSASISAAPLP